MKSYFVYILTNHNDAVMYVGVTSNLERRVAEHRQKLIPGFTKKYNVFKLVHFEQFSDPVNAITREKQIKGWRRSKKDGLVKQENPEWKDLSLGWHTDSSQTLGMTKEGA